MLQKLVLFVSLPFLFIGFSNAQGKPAPSPTPESNYYHNLTAKELADLEAKLKTSPDDSDSRTNLINYYAERDTTASKKAVQRHRLALIENNPQKASVLYLGSWLPEDFTKPEHIELKNAWLKQISLRKKDKEVRFQAASFFDYEPALAEKILKEGQALTPDDFEYSVKLIEFYEASITNEYGESEVIRLNKRLAIFKKIVIEAQNALALMKKAESTEEIEEEIRKMLAVSAKYSLETGDLELAKKSADELITKSGEPKMLIGSIFTPEIDNFQIANSVLGRIALRAGNVEKAKEHLLNSIRLIDDEKNENPRIDAEFLEEMLVRNGGKIVVEYLQLFAQSKHLEESAQQEVKDMIMFLNRGKIPDFRSNTSLY